MHFHRPQGGCMVFLPPTGGIYTGARRAPTFIYHLPFTIYHFSSSSRRPAFYTELVSWQVSLAMFTDSTPLRHYVALFAPLGNMSLDSQVATLPYESSSFATSRGRKGLGQGGSGPYDCLPVPCLPADSRKRTADGGKRPAPIPSLQSPFPIPHPPIPLSLCPTVPLAH